MPKTMATKKERVNEGKNQAKRFSCEKCSYKTNDSSNFYKHKRAIHEKSSLFECEQCSYSSRDRSNLAKHVEIQHKKLKKYKCNKCERVFAVTNELKLHIKAKHEQVKDLKCDICDFKTNYSGSLQTHIHFVHGDNIKAFPCPIVGCPKMFGFKHHMSCHVQDVHHKIKNHGCPICEKKFCREPTLRYHIQQVHEWKDADAVTCIICDTVFKNKKSLESHIKRLHMRENQEKSVQCKRCEKKFRTKGEMEGHFRGVHKNEYKQQKFFKIPTICEICDTIFTSKRSLRYHISEIHSVNTRYQCKICLEHFAIESRLKIHFHNKHKSLNYETDNQNDGAIFHSALDKEPGVVIDLKNKNFENAFFTTEIKEESA